MFRPILRPTAPTPSTDLSDCYPQSHPPFFLHICLSMSLNVTRKTTRPGWGRSTDRFDVKLNGALRVVILQDGDLCHVARDPDAGLGRVIPFCPRQLHCSQVDEERLGCLRNVVLKPNTNPYGHLFHANEAVTGDGLPHAETSICTIMSTETSLHILHILYIFYVWMYL